MSQSQALVVNLFLPQSVPAMHVGAHLKRTLALLLDKGAGAPRIALVGSAGIVPIAAFGTSPAQIALQRQSKDRLWNKQKEIRRVAAEADIVLVPHPPLIDAKRIAEDGPGWHADMPAEMAADNKDLRTLNLIGVTGYPGDDREIALFERILDRYSMPALTITQGQISLEDQIRVAIIGEFNARTAPAPEQS